MFDSILGSLFGNKTETKKIPPNNVLDRIKRRKLIIQKFRKVDPNNNLKRARIAKELLSVSKTEGERKAARKFYKDETALNNLKNKIKASASINEKLSLARQGKRLATKNQNEFWENLINKLQKRKQERKNVVANEKKALTTNTGKEQDMEKDTEKIKEEQGRDIDENKSEKDTDNDIEETEEDEESEENEEEVEDTDGDVNEDENEEGEGEPSDTLSNDINDKDGDGNLI